MSEILDITSIDSLEPTKANIEKVSSSLSGLALNGHIDPVEFAVRIEFLTKCLEEAKKKMLDVAIDSVKTKTTLFGATIEVIESGVKYDYQSNGNWSELEAKIIPLKEAQKLVENDIKMATKLCKSILDGDEIVASPVKKESKTTLKITLPK
jgi:hypothetical protein